MQSPRIRVLIADDDPALADAVADTVRTAGDFEVVGVAHDTAQVLQLAQSAHPDVVLMDVRMPGGGGVAATRQLMQKRPDVKVVALSAHEDRTSALQMLEAGAVAYIVKGSLEIDIIDAVRRASAGQMSISIELGSTAVNELMREVRDRKENEHVLRRSQHQSAAILEGVPDAIIVVGAGGVIEQVNGRTETLFGYRSGELVGQVLETLVPERYRHVHEHLRTKYCQEAYARPMEAGLSLSAMRKDGTEFQVDISLAPLETEDGPKFVAAVRDITHRTLGEAAQRKSEQLFRGLLDSAPDAMVIADSDGLIQVVNTQTENLFGYSRAELRGQSVDILLPERFRASHWRHRAGYLARPVVRAMGAGLELYGRRKDGTEFPVDISLSPMMDSESGALVIAAVRDVTARREAKKKIDDSFETLQRQRLFARLIAAQEEERLRIASDIHDDTIQSMTATSLRMQQLRRHLTDPDQIALLTKLEEAVRQSIIRLRRLMFDLRPASLDRTGLASALRELLERLQDETHLTFTLENQLSTEPEGGIRTALYRIAQEALTNVKKHAAATEVHVELRSVGTGCRVRIQDNGHGFDIDHTDSRPGHFGLVSMRERAQIAGGWWLVRSRAEGGTIVEFWLPMDAETNPEAAEVAHHV